MELNRMKSYMTDLSFGDALEALRKNQRAARKSWNGKNIFIAIQFDTEISDMTHMYIYIDTTGLVTDNPNAYKVRVAWTPTQTDMLAEDWYILDKGITNG